MCSIVSADGLFKNPDGRPGTYGIEPFFLFHWSNKAHRTNPIDGATDELPNFRLRDTAFGLRLIVPLAEWGTIFTHGSFGNYRTKWEHDVNGEPTSIEFRQPQYTFGVSLRIWIFDPWND